MMRIILVGAAVALASTAAGASSPDAWVRFDREVARRCIAASGLGAARASRVIGFDDSLGKVATLVSGRQGRIATSKLCLYDKRGKRTWVDEATGWTAPPAR